MRSRTGRGTLVEIRDGSGEPQGDPEWAGGLLGYSGTGRGTLGEVQDGSGTSGEDWDGSVDSRGGPKRVKDVRDGEPSGISLMGRWNLGVV